LTINGEAKEFAKAMTVAELVVELGLGGGPVAVELNREIVPRAQHGSRTIADGDVLEIVHMVGGG
jgi:sulfur carrier protein